MPIVRVALPLPLPRLFDYFAGDACAADVGRCVRVPFGRGEKVGLIVEVPATSQVPPGRLKPVHHIQREVPPLPPAWLALAGFAARYYQAALGEVIALALPPGLRQARAVQAEERDPLVAVSLAGRAALAAARRTSRALACVARLDAVGPARVSRVRDWPEGAALAEARRKGWVEAAGAREPARAEGVPVPTPAQAAALAQLEAGLGSFVPWLLHGVTGSGKTEVYLRLAGTVLRRGAQVLLLVPEIGLTPQFEARVMARFPAARIVCLHSAMAEGVRSAGFVDALAGAADLIVGTRLAIFTPLPRLGLIVVDEEHDPSYKQQEGVRYSARDLAVWRARQAGVPVVLGSATPSLESWRHAGTGRYRLLRLEARALASRLPQVGLVDTRQARLDEGLSPALLQALAQRLARGEQSLVFLNRRGYAPVLSCPACGWVSPCPHCAANLVVHLADRRMRCHHCGFDTAIMRACPQCGNLDIRPFGRGTQRVEERLAQLFPQARVLRLDRDAARTRLQWESLLAQVERGEADILVGTQIMAKGHDFPRLTLVGVLGADASLFAADFRAPERLFAQLMQVGGRAGRARLPGEVLIQTDYPAHPLYACLLRHDYDAFAAHALAEREQAGFPPFSHQAMLRADAPRLDEALAFLHAAVAVARPLCDARLQLYDPVPMRMSRLARRERAQLLVEAQERRVLHAFLQGWGQALQALPCARALRWHLDVDPLEV